MKLRRIPQDSSRQRSAGGGAALPSRKRPLVEAIEPRRLYSADLSPAGAVWTPQQQEVRLTDDRASSAHESDTALTASTQQQSVAREIVFDMGRVV